MALQLFGLVVAGDVAEDFVVVRIYSAVGDPGARAITTGGQWSEVGEFKDW